MAVAIGELVITGSLLLLRFELYARIAFVATLCFDALRDEVDFSQILIFDEGVM